jgi:hypothetical protein
MMAGNGIGNIWHELVQPALGFKSMAPGVARRNPLVGNSETTRPSANQFRAIASAIPEPVCR